LFDGTNDSLGNTTADNPATRTWFVVAVRGSLTTRQCVVASSFADISLYGSYNTLGFSATNGYPQWHSRENNAGSNTLRAVSTSASTTIPTVFRYQYTQAEINAQSYNNIIRRANGVADNTGGSSMENYNRGVYLGAANQTNATSLYAFFFNGSLCEVLAYDALLTASQCTSVENYLKSGWGVTY
jgi:hypothetical protein